jgi:RHS repeat-associated protein
MAPHRSSTTYDAVGNPVTETDALNRQKRTTYDGLHRPELVTYPNGTTSATEYNSLGQAWRVRDQRGYYTVTEFDAAGRAVLVRLPEVDSGVDDGSTAIRKHPETRTIYDAAGNTIATVDALGRRWDYAYDPRNRKNREWGPLVSYQDTGAGKRPLVSTFYDKAGNPVKLVDAKGNITETVYDEANRVTDTYAPALPLAGGGVVRPHIQTKYDANGNVIEATDANGNKVVNTYDVLNRLTEAEDGEGNKVYNRYDASGNLAVVFDGNQNRTEFVYDGMNRNTKVKDHLGREVIFTYDALNKVQRTDSLMRVTGYFYDEMNRLSTVSYVGGGATNPDRAYSYDAAGNILAVTEAGKAGKADAAYSYDELGRVVTETSGGVTHHYRYDLAGNRVYVKYGGTDREIVSTYDSLNRLSTLSESDRVSTYRYDLNGNIRKKLLANGGVIVQEFDAANRMTSQTATDGGSAQLYRYDYEYDLKGSLTKSTEDYATGGIADRVVVNGYDRADRLVLESITVAGGVGSQLTDYEFDGANNRTKMTRTGGSQPGITSYKYNRLNQLVSYAGPGGVFTLVYDANGNRTSKSGGLVYGYDFENRLISAEGGPVDCSYLYDYRTRRVERTEDATTTKVIFSSGLSVQELEGSTLKVEYLRGSDWGGGVGGILYTLRDGDPSFNHYNNRGDVTTKTDGDSEVTYQAAYEAFGTRTQEDGTTEDRQKANTKDEDPTGFLNEGFRYRDLETGVFITRDPAGLVDGPNLYAYVQQNPWSGFDPQGLWNVWNPSTWGIGEFEGVDSLNPVGKSANWDAYSADDVAKSATIAGDVLTFGLIQPLHEQAEQDLASGDEFKYSKAFAHVGRTALIGAATLGVGQGVAAIPEVSAFVTAHQSFFCAASAVSGVVGAAGTGIQAGTAYNRFAEGDIVGGIEAGGDALVSAILTFGVFSQPKCLAEGTLVATPSGLVPIEELSVGSQVLAYDVENGKVAIRTIEDTLENFTYNWVDIQVGGSVVTATRMHPFWVESKSAWILAIDLEPGDIVRCVDGALRAIDDIQVRALEVPETTYNLEISIDHNFFVGEAGILVHNGAKTRITYTAPEYDAAGNYKGIYSGKATMRGAGLDPQKVLDKRFSGKNHHPGHILGEPVLDDVHANHAQMRGREQLLHEKHGAASTNKNNPVGKNNKRIERYRQAAQKKYGETFKNGLPCK